jgi:hypothetical protein
MILVTVALPPTVSGLLMVKLLSSTALQATTVMVLATRTSVRVENFAHKAQVPPLPLLLVPLVMFSDFSMTNLVKLV